MGIVKSGMFAVSHQHQIFECVIGLAPVYVMNNFIANKFPSDAAFNNQNVLALPSKFSLFENVASPIMDSC